MIWLLLFDIANVCVYQEETLTKLNVMDATDQVVLAVTNNATREVENAKDAKYPLKSQNSHRDFKQNTTGL